MLTAETKKKIDSARDILVGKVPDPKAQVEQITTALIYKFMDDMDKRAATLPKGKPSFFTNGFEKFSWSKLLSPRLTGQERWHLYDEALKKMSKNPHIQPFFQDIFKDAFLPYRDPETLSLFLKQINDFEYDHSENLGDAFEYLLSVLGSQGDAGQFRTPRHIIDFIVEVLDPKKDETILDPACGTAGFLISAYKHILKANNKKPLTPDEKKRLMSNLAGYDISPDMVKLSLVNMYLHGFPSPSIHEYDTLTSDERWDERFDVMMANPPFMSPKGGIRPHKRFAVQANRAEVLFVDYIMEHLNSKGRAGIIVPEGIISNQQTAYKELRRLLVADGLYAVVSLPAGVFNPYAGVKTSVLFFDNQLSKHSKEVLFIKVLNDGFDLGAQRKPIEKNDLPQALKILKAHKEAILNNKRSPLRKDNLFAWTINKKKISQNEDLHLSGENYLPAKVIARQWDTVSLDEVAKVGSGNGAPQKDEYFRDGTSYFFRTSDVGKVHISDNLIEARDKINEKAIKELRLVRFPQNTILFPKSGASTFLNHRAMLGTEGYVSSHLATIIPDTSRILPKFLFHLLCRVDARSLTADQAYPSLKLSAIERIKIPLPPLDIQKEIVQELESYQRIIDGARQVVEHHKPSIRFQDSWEMIDLGKLAEMEYGYTETAKAKGDARFIRITDISNEGYLKLDGAKYVNLTKGAKAYLLKNGDVLVARTGATYGKTMIFGEEYPAVFASFLIRLNFDTSKILPEYYWIFAQTDRYWKQARTLVSGGAQPQFNGGALKRISVPVPTIEEQQKIIAQTKDEQAHIVSARKLVELYEEKIKNKIAEIWGE